MSAELQQHLQPRLANLRRVHWKTPAMMGTCFTASIILALGHYFFYKYMDFRSVVDDSQQQWVTRAGTALAFMVKLTLAMTTGAAYTQCLWYSVQFQSIKVEKMDSMFSVLGNALEFIDLRFWLGNPLVALPAMVTWLLPLSAITTPGTLSVQLLPYISSGLTNIPLRNFATGGFATTLEATNSSSSFVGTTGLADVCELSRLQGAILPLRTPSNNQTYALEVVAPAITCAPTNNATSADFLPAIKEYEIDTNMWISYLSWTPQPGLDSNLNGTAFEENYPFMGAVGDLDTVSKDAAKIHIFTSTTPNWTVSTSSSTTNLVSCSLFNASYSVNFELLSNGQQSVTANRTFLNWVPPSMAMLSNASTTIPIQETFNLMAVMTEFGASVAGISRGPTNKTQAEEDNPWAFTNLALSPNFAPLFTNRNGRELGLSMSDLNDNLESLFQNMTLSVVFSQTALLSAESDNGTVEYSSAIVTSTEFRNTYTFAARDLVLAYGLSIVAALVCLLLGIFALSSTGVAYSNNFSTVLRTTRTASFDTLMDDDDDFRGAEPLPEHIAKATIRFAHGYIESSRRAADGEKVLPLSSSASSGSDKPGLVLVT